jgi:uncharacterized protein (TIGR00288 family)
MAPLGRLFGSASGGSDRGDGDRADPGAGDGRSPDDRPRVGLFVDGPNALREEFDVDLDDVREVAGRYGRLALVRLYLDEHATPSLIRAAEARGFAVVTTSGDVDVRLAVDATAAVVDGTVDVLVICSRDADFKPVVERAAERGVATVAVAPGEYGRSDALSNAVDDAVSVGPE